MKDILPLTAASTALCHGWSVSDKKIEQGINKNAVLYARQPVTRTAHKQPTYARSVKRVCESNQLWGRLQVK